MNKNGTITLLSIALMVAIAILFPLLYLKVWPNNYLVALEGNFATYSLEFVQNHLHNPFVTAVAYMNHKLETKLNILLLLVFVFYAFIQNAKHKKQMFLHFIYLLLILEGGIYLNDFVFLNLFDFSRSSPNIVLGLPRLDELYGNSHLKSVSYTTFPGGHAFAAFLWAFMYSYVIRGWSKFLFFTAAIIISLPRVLVGLHWISDVLFAVYLAYFYSFIALNVPVVKDFINPKQKR